MTPKKIFPLLACLFMLTGTGAQQLSKPENHSYYVDNLANSRNDEYQRVLKLYDQYIAANPADYLVQIERCRFMDQAMGDEEYNPNYEEAEACRQKLEGDFPEAPEVMLYKLEFLWGDSVIPACEQVIDDYEKNADRWTGKEIWQVYEKIANAHEQDENHQRAIDYMEIAVEKNDTLDRTLFLAQQYKELKKNDKAIALLLSSLDSTDETWDLNQKGKLLLDLGKPDKALIAYRMAKKDSGSYQDANTLAQVFIDNGFYTDARECLLQSVQTSYYTNKTQALQKLFDYDIKYGRKDSAQVSYNRLVEEDFWNDPFGINRFRLFLKAPSLWWSAKDFLRVLLALLGILFFLVLPHIFVLPVYNISAWFKNRGMVLPQSDFRWSLRHVWVGFSLIVLSDVAIALIFNNGVWSDNEDFETVSSLLARVTLFHLLGFFLVTVLLTRKSDLEMIWGNFWAKGKSIGTGIGMAMLLKLGLGIYLSVFNYVHNYWQGTAAINFDEREDIMSLIKFYHPAVAFLLIGILVPIAEEIIFRGVFLSAFEKYMKFFLANCLQSVVFAAVHQSWKLAPFYFAFGFLAGHYRLKSKSLAPGISIQMTNNILPAIGYIALA